MRTPVLSMSAAARSAEGSGNGTASMLSNLAELFSSAAKDVRVNSATANAIAQRIEDMVAVLAQALEDHDTLQPLTQFKLSVEEIHSELKAQAKRSYLSQLLHHARDRESLVTMSERVRDAFNLLMVNMRLHSAVLSSAASTRTDSAGLANALASMAADVAKSDTLGCAAPSDIASVSAARLPTRPHLYFGRQSETETVAAAVTADEAGRVAILGGPGMGKTTLSVAVLRRPLVAARFGKRRYFVPCDSAEGHSRFLTVLAAAFGIVAADPSVAQGQLQALLSAGPSLLVIDNFESAWETAEQRLDAERLLQFLDAIDTLSLILTLRGTERPNGVRWARPFLAPLAPLSDAASKQTFISIADVPSDADALLERLIAPLDNIPLAIVLLANLAQYQPLEALISQWNILETAMLALGGASSRLHSLDISIQLSVQSPRMRAVPSAQSLLSALSLLPHGVVDTDLAHWGLDNSARGLSVLIQSSLVEQSAERRIRVLAPIRSFVLAHYPPSEAESSPVYAHYFSLAGLTGQAGEWAQLVSSVTPEVNNIESVILHALKHSPAPRCAAVEAAVGICCFYAEHTIGYAPDLLHTALAEATGADFVKGRADLYFHWARMANNALVPGDPQALYRQARELYQRLGDTGGILDCGAFLTTYLNVADAVCSMAPLCALADTYGDPVRIARCAHYQAASLERAGEPEAAIAQYARAIEVARSVPTAAFPRRNALIAHSQYWTSVNLSRLGRRRAADDMLAAALATFEVMGDAQGTAITLSNLAAAALEQGQMRNAIDYAERALAVRGAEASRGHANTLVILADAYLWSGDRAAAATTIERIVKTVPDGGLTLNFRCLVMILRGRLAQQRGDLSEARAILQHACALARGRDPVEIPEALAMQEIKCMRYLAEVEYASDRVEDAETLATVAAAMSRRTGWNRDTVRSLLMLAEVMADDEVAEQILDAFQVWLHHDEANLLLGQAALRRATIARRRGKQAVARRQAAKALLQFADWKDTRRIELAQSVLHRKPFPLARVKP